MNTFLTTLAVAGLTLASGQAFAQNNPVSIEELHFAGSGCDPADDPLQLVDSNGDGQVDQFHFLFDKYQAVQGPGVAITERRKNCNINVTLKVPRGNQYTVTTVLYEGFADIRPGVTGVQRSRYVFPLHGESSTETTVLNGPYNAPYKREDNIDKIVWSPCNRTVPLSIRTSVFLQGDDEPESLIALDTISGGTSSGRFICYINFRRCS